MILIGLTFKSLHGNLNRFLYNITHKHAGHTRKASRISKAVVDNFGKGVGNFYLS